ncbi:MAG: hypothetical protein AMS22_04135 [Thiotrichales bacterium SG8_50]|nr:MAG: hypothetical protein AMS22_04135 [Thiotrichales bacterium SG8_50]
MSAERRELRRTPHLLIGALAGVGLLTILGSGGGGIGLPETLTLSAEAVGPAQVNLNWTPHPDLVTGYVVYRDGTSITDVYVSGTALSDTDISPQTRYCYVVYAYLALYGEVGRSNSSCVQTLAAGEGWSIETVGSGGSPDLVVTDAAIHLAYDNGMLMHASNAGGTWQTETVDGSAGATPAIGIDAAGALHVAYGDTSSYDLKYATNVTGVWIDELVDVQGDTGFSPALAVATDSTIHMSYHVWWDGPVATFDLRYAAGEAGSWTTTTIGQVATNGGDTAIAVDSQGKVHVSYVAGDVECSVVYASNVSGTWQTRSLGRCPLGHGYTDIAVDDDDHVHVVFQGYQAADATFALCYATDAGGEWVDAQIEAFDWIPGAVSIAIDGTGRVHVSYADHNASLKYATNASGTWDTRFVDVDTLANAIALGPDDAVHIAYSAQSGTIRHAVKR